MYKDGEGQNKLFKVTSLAGSTTSAAPPAAASRIAFRARAMFSILSTPTSSQGLTPIPVAAQPDCLHIAYQRKRTLSPRRLLPTPSIKLGSIDSGFRDKRLKMS
jgi:hypothetical protein